MRMLVYSLADLFAHCIAPNHRSLAVQGDTTREGTRTRRRG